MDNILIEVEKLKNMILETEEYKKFIKSRQILDNNQEINDIIEKIKENQKSIIKKENENKDTTKEEINLRSLYSELDKYDEYKIYLENSKVLNILITGIQKKFEDYFNKFVI